jgi:CBS domain-containing protein
MDHPKVPVARELMTARLITMTPEMSAVEAAELLLRHSISGAPVVDGDGHLLGLVSEFDCLRAVASAEYEMDLHDGAETVAELMTRACHTITPDLDLYAVAHAFVNLGVRRLPVVDEGQLIGQVSRRDALGAAVRIRRELQKAHPRYPDYPAGRDPIRDYPRVR